MRNRTVKEELDDHYRVVIETARPYNLDVYHLPRQGQAELVTWAGGDEDINVESVRYFLDQHQPPLPKNVYDRIIEIVEQESG